MLILLAYILANHSFVQANGAHAVPSRPKVIPCQILCPSEIPPVDKNRGLSFELSHRVRNAELGRYAQTHVHMVSKSMPLDQFQPKLLAQLPENSGSSTFVMELPLERVCSTHGADCVELGFTVS